MKSKKAEYSKKALNATIVLSAAVVMFTCVMVAVTKNLEPLNYLVPAVAAQTTVGLRSYYRKAEVENRIKLKKLYKIPLDNEDFTAKGEY